MRWKRLRPRRPGSILPLVATALVGMCGFLALAVDVGMIAISKVQCQSAADVAAMAGARRLNGIVPQDLTGATAIAQAAALNYNVLSQPLQTSHVVVQHGTYHYDSTNQVFTPQFTLQASEKYNLTQATVSHSPPSAFARVVGISAWNVVANATAAHRPRDVTIILDYSGSMNNESDLWNNESYLDNGSSAPSNPNNTSNNTETVYPLFGHYSKEKNYSNYANYANLLCPSADGGNPLASDPRIGKCNVTQTILGVPPLVKDFWLNTRGASAGSGFSSAPDSYATAPGGDNYLRNNNNVTLPYATNVKDINNGSSTRNGPFEDNGYKNFTGVAFQGFTQGPRYWGKTFYIWPPDPTNDWRKKYFLKTGGAPVDDNTILWDNTGSWNPPGNGYTINYKAILAWITANNSGTYPMFPPILRSGNTLFYDQIPSDVQSSAYDPNLLNYQIGNSNERFWKEYIDYVLGVWQDPNSNLQGPQRPACSIGPDYTFGTPKISAKPTTGSPPPYMNYSDNPQRPRHRFWFGAMTMIQFMSDTGILPGTTHDIAMYPMKIGVGGALTDIQNNHPNDQVGLILFNRPQYSNDAPGTGAFNQSQFSLGNNYAGMINSLWIPPNSGSADVRPWDSNGAQTPRAHGDYNSNTASSYGFMLAYNQFSASPTLKNLDQSSVPGVGGVGRVGAQRLVIYETDGMANVESLPQNGFSNAGAYNSFYKIQPGQTVNSGGYSSTALFQTAQAICNNSDGTPGTPSPYTPFSPNNGYPGFSKPGKPVSIECIAFGAIFESSSSIQDSSVALLTRISNIGGTVFPTSASDPTYGYKWCIGTISQRQAKLKQAFLNAMDTSIPVSLVE